jgi:hypothetical protein
MAIAAINSVAKPSFADSVFTRSTPNYCYGPGNKTKDLT